MSWNDFSLSATVSANAAATSQTAAGLREAGSGSSFEQELRRQTEAGDSPEPATPATAATPAPAAAAGPDRAAETGPAAGDTPADWLALLDGMRARAETKPATPAVPGTGELIASGAAAVPAADAASAPVKKAARETSEPEPANALDGAQLSPLPLPTLLSTAPPAHQPPALPGPGELDAIAARALAAAVIPAADAVSAPVKKAAREASEPKPANALDGAQLPPLPTLLSTAPPALAPATAALEPASAPLGARAHQPPSLPDPGELDAIAARALAAAAPQPTSSSAAQIGGADAPELAPGLDPLAQALPGSNGIASGAERPPELVPVERHVATPMGQRGWDQAVSQQVSWLVRDQLQSASLSLNPPHLGPIQVTLQLDQQQATVQFVSAAPEVRQALQDALPALRAMLGEAGIELGQADVGSRQHERQQPAFQRSNRRSDAAADEPVEALGQTGTRGGGLLNLFA